MRLVVFGAAGFLGSHVADQLSEEGHTVVLYDKRPSPYRRPDQEEWLGDILDQDQVELATSGCDVIYNFAALADLNAAMTAPVDTVQKNILGNCIVLEAARKNKVRRYIYASTVYVNSRHGGFYRCSKQAAEQYVEQYQSSYDLDFTILRYGSLYGPRSDSTNGLYRIVANALKEGTVRYHGSPGAMREYIHVEDAARASVEALGESFRNQSFVLTGQEPMSVLDMHKMLAEVLGLPCELNATPDHEQGHYVRTPYAYQPRRGFKYIPPQHVDLGQGLVELAHEVATKERLNDDP
ncbi:NAD-dependent epimerase/dehydratase [Halorhodospira halochloris]|uniref:NAD-dependent epimerase/dehydratase n=1 Tax=Halorhodospira halochloris TaxID=1052 RepID=A0A0X8X7Q6_HALHR|nr:NAD(P)-dependent oxidoreductase [Halorhodospira halochloris]MBK1652671.1 NAD-dependent epimerase [Halorhodospira halochloris]BAU57095.1 NAD-dependent epimerase/dehydratase [Halorhodospira halochloris]